MYRYTCIQCTCTWGCKLIFGLTIATNLLCHVQALCCKYWQCSGVRCAQAFLGLRAAGILSDASKMKGTKVLTLGAGREVLPHNMAVTIYIHAL